jgi:RNA polymerase sigma-70 factor (subfamily 1)
MRTIRREPALTNPEHDFTKTVELVRRAQEGSEEAKNELFARYSDRMLPWIRARLPSDLRVTNDSSDILQQTLIPALKNFDQFEMLDDESFLHWLKMIARNAIRDQVTHHRALKRDRGREVPMHVVLDGDRSGAINREPAYSGSTPSRELVRGEGIEGITRCLNELREDYRTVIMQRIYHGASWASVAKDLDSPSPNAARMLYWRAITELAKLVRRDGGLDSSSRSGL